MCINECIKLERIENLKILIKEKENKLDRVRKDIKKILIFKIKRIKRIRYINEK